MKKTITITKIIEECRTCPNFYFGFPSDPSECTAILPEHKLIPKGGGIPDWCPLENAE